jgi:hypothetical protein
LQIRFGSRKKIRFTDKTHPAQGIAAALIGVCSLVFLNVLFMLSSKAQGNAGLFIGVLGMLDLAVSIVGFVLALKCYKKEDIYMLTPALGAVLNGLMIICCMLLYVVGSV